MPQLSRPLWRLFRLGALALCAAGTLCVLLRNGASGLGRPFSLLHPSGGARLAEVKDLRNAHDTQIPFLVPPIIACFASTVYGLTNFGENITFMLLWSLSGAVGILGGDYSFAKGVLFTNIVPLVAMPVNMWISRSEIRHTIWWGAFCFVMLSVFEPAGVKMLLFDHTGAARHIIAAMFAVFAFWRANSGALDFGRARAAAASPEPLWNDTDASSGPPYTLDESETVVLHSRERWNAHWSYVEQLLNQHPTLRLIYESAFPRISETNKTTETAVLIIAGGFLLSGFMFGLASTGGPPMMVSFILLKVTKGGIRAIRNVACFASILMWFVIMLHHDDGLHMWSVSEWPMFLALCIAGTIGSSFGAWLRNFISRDHLLFCFYFLIWGDAALLFDVFDSSSKLLAPSDVIIATVILVVSVAVCYFSPDSVDALLQRSDEMLSILSPREQPVSSLLTPNEREQLIGHIEALKAGGRMSQEQEQALSDAVEQRDPRAAAALRQASREENVQDAVEEALLSLARRRVSERK